VGRPTLLTLQREPQTPQGLTYYQPPTLDTPADAGVSFFLIGKGCEREE